MVILCMLCVTSCVRAWGGGQVSPMGRRRVGWLELSDIRLTSSYSWETSKTKEDTTRLLFYEQCAVLEGNRISSILLKGTNSDHSTNFVVEVLENNENIFHLFLNGRNSIICFYIQV